MLFFHFVITIITLIHPLSPALAYHENLPTHTPSPLSPTPSSTLTPSPSPTNTSVTLPDLNDKSTLLLLIALVGIGGLILFITRPK